MLAGLTMGTDLLRPGPASPTAPGSGSPMCVPAAGGRRRRRRRAGSGQGSRARRPCRRWSPMIMPCNGIPAIISSDHVSREARTLAGHSEPDHRLDHGAHHDPPGPPARHRGALQEASPVRDAQRPGRMARRGNQYRRSSPPNRGGGGAPRASPPGSRPSPPRVRRSTTCIGPPPCARPPAMSRNDKMAAMGVGACGSACLMVAWCRFLEHPARDPPLRRRVVKLHEAKNKQAARVELRVRPVDRAPPSSSTTRPAGFRHGGRVLLPS